MKFTFNNTNIGVTAKLVKAVMGFPNEVKSKGTDYHNEFRVKLLRNGIERTFLYYDSTAAYYDGVVELDADALKNALGSIVRESITTGNNFEDFCLEFGYDTDSKSAERTYLAILKDAKKMEELGFTQDELIEISNEID
jgi:hypothetical protein